MTSPKKPRKRNPAWKDTPDQKAARQRARYERMKKAAEDAGYSSWAALVTALLNGEIKVVKVGREGQENL